MANETLQITDLVKKIKNPLAKYNDGEKTTSIYLKDNDDTYYVICSKENFKECTFFATVKNVPYNETISRDEFYKIKEFIKKK
ncbi:MAG: hypothetical protein RLZZ64_1433 [Bacteroidota bacterium]|jgi:hypothetical protein